jgi:hypothetical protein
MPVFVAAKLTLSAKDDADISIEVDKATYLAIFQSLDIPPEWYTGQPVYGGENGDKAESVTGIFYYAATDVYQRGTLIPLAKDTATEDLFTTVTVPTVLDGSLENATFTLAITGYAVQSEGNSAGPGMEVTLKSYFDGILG